VAAMYENKAAASVKNPEIPETGKSSGSFSNRFVDYAANY
jgi:hypothetical protein